MAVISTCIVSRTRTKSRKGKTRQHQLTPQAKSTGYRKLLYQTTQQLPVYSSITRLLWKRLSSLLRAVPLHARTSTYQYRLSRASLCKSTSVISFCFHQAPWPLTCSCWRTQMSLKSARLSRRTRGPFHVSFPPLGHLRGQRFAWTYLKNWPQWHRWAAWEEWMVALQCL